MGINWLDIPLEEFAFKYEDDRLVARPHGDGEAQRILVRLSAIVENSYEELLGPEDFERFEQRGEVPVIRNSHRGYESPSKLTLRDLPAVLDALIVLGEEAERERREEVERKAAERKERNRIRAKERRRLKKLGEW